MIANSITALVTAALLGATTTVTRPVEIKSEVLRFVVDPGQGGAITELNFRDNPRVNLAGGGGLIQEGFGVGSFYAPNRRVNETLEIIEDTPGQTRLRFSYDCEGPGIQGLHITRVMEPVPEEASIRVTWTLEHRGEETLWMTPWVRHEVAPGGSADAADVITLPTLDGVRVVDTPQWAAATRNWSAVTDPLAKESVVGVYNAKDLYATLAIPVAGESPAGMQSAFVPFLMEPGDTWDTNYRINLVRGLERIDFATQEIAGWIEPSPKWFYGYYTSMKPMMNLSLRSTLTDPELYRLPNQLFSLKPGTVVQCLFPDMPRDLMERPLVYSALFLQNDVELALNSEMDAPDNRFHAVSPNGSSATNTMSPWTDAGQALARKPREVSYVPALEGMLPAWWASGLEKVFRKDTPVASGPAQSEYGMVLARNESESVQLVIQHPQGVSRAVEVRVTASPLRHTSGEDSLPRDAVSVYRVDYARVDVPTHFESLTGSYPDRLVPTGDLVIEPETMQPVWITVRAPENARPGDYTGTVRLTWGNGRTSDVGLRVTVQDFTLPRVPALKTNIGLPPGMVSGERAPVEALRKLAREHRVTFSGLAKLLDDAERPDASLKAAKSRLGSDERNGVSSYAVSAELLDDPKALKKLDAFVKENSLAGKVFAHVAQDPRQDAWEAGVERIRAWNEAAPNIPAMVTTQGMHPFLAEDAGVWALHTPVIDTGNLGAVREAMGKGTELWLYVNHGPGRPYANLFTDMDTVDHRILFWQAWALGATGFHYANAADWSRESHADVTPANGYGLLLYPGDAGPVPSLRLEAMRDGIEDYDYLVLLMERLRRAEGRSELAGLVTNIKARTDLSTLMQGMTDYDRDFRALAEKRREIGDAIVALGEALAN